MERDPVTRTRIEQFLRQLGRRYRGSGRIYLAGGAHMVLAGFRGQTEDIDYTARLQGDDQGFTMAVRSLIRDLNISAEPAGPGDFIPLPSGWEERSHFVGRYERVDVYTFDPVSTALSKIERGSSRDIEDALALLRRRIITVPELQAAFDEILPRLETESLRVDEADFRRKFESFLRLARETRSEP